MRASRCMALCAAAVTALLLAAVPAAACTSCYGAADNGSPLVSGARLGVFLLLGVTVAVLGGFVKFFFYLRHCARRAEDDRISSEWAQFQRSSST